MRDPYASRRDPGCLAGASGCFGLRGVVLACSLLASGAVASCRRQAKPPRHPELILPSTTSETKLLPGPTVSVTPRAVFFEHERIVSLRAGQVPPGDKRHGFFIDSLYARINSAGRAQREWEKRGGPRFEGYLSLRIDRDVTFRLAVDVIYSVFQARFGALQLVARRPDGGLGALLLYHERTSRIMMNFPTEWVELRLVELGPLPPGDGGPARPVTETARALLRGIRGKRAQADLPPAPGASAATRSPPREPDRWDCERGSTRLELRSKGVAVRFRVSAAGEVTHLATRGSTPPADAFCIAEWLNHRFDPTTVPSGDYSLRFALAEGPDAAVPATPAAAELRPLEAVLEGASPAAWVQDQEIPRDETPSHTLQATVIMTARGYDLRSRSGSECTRPDVRHGATCIPTAPPGAFTPSMLTELGRQALALHRKISGKPRYAWDRHFVHLLIDGSVKMADVVRTLDALRELPGQDPRRRCRVPVISVSPDTRVHESFPTKRRGHAGDLRWQHDCMFHIVHLGFETNAPPLETGSYGFPVVSAHGRPVLERPGRR